MVDFIVVALLFIAIGAALVYLVKAKKNGAKCIGCPAGTECAHGGCGGCRCNCESESHGHTDTKEKQ